MNPIRIAATVERWSPDPANVFEVRVEVWRDNRKTEHRTAVHARELFSKTIFETIWDHIGKEMKGYIADQDAAS